MLPTRVLDVSADEPVLLLTNGKCAEYVALSHCWGGRTNQMTTLENYESHQRGIKLDSLSKTFRDAVQVTQSIGIDYLWIDSLCIIQNDEADWGKEAAVMGSVYEQAYCTIMAAAASNGSVGCFAQSVDQDDMIQISSAANNARHGDIYLARRPRQVHVDQEPLV
jgi:hypothetical protein